MIGFNSSRPFKFFNRQYILENPLWKNDNYRRTDIVLELAIS